MLHSDRKVDGIILEMMCNVIPQKQKDLITKICKGLLANKSKGKWGSTNENLFVLLGLKKYFEVFEKDVPDFSTNCWLGDDWMGENKFKGRETETKELLMKMKYILDVEIDEKNNKVIEKSEIKEKKDEKNLIIEKIGQGRCYYRIGLTYAPKNTILLPRDYGFIVERKYVHVTDPNHVVFDEKNKIWKIKGGELVRVKLTLTNTSRRYHVALVDKLPAGFEVLNPDLKTTGVIPTGKKLLNLIFFKFNF
jgi:alpha-2-macroglobulin